ncbi:hypothetical protein PMAYCL1PPCAC_28239, partial [Pristionchus mayeri]
YEKNSTYISKNFVVVSIYYRELGSLVYSAATTPSIVSLLSINAGSIGGSAGFCLGFSALTVIEVVVLLLKTLRYLTYKKGELDKKGKEYEKNREAEQEGM